MLAAESAAAGFMGTPTSIADASPGRRSSAGSWAAMPSVLSRRWHRRGLGARLEARARRRDQILPRIFTNDPDRLVRFSARRGCSPHSIIRISARSTAWKTLTVSAGLELVEATRWRNGSRGSGRIRFVDATGCSRWAAADRSPHDRARSPTRSRRPTKGIIHRDLKPANIRSTGQRREGARRPAKCGAGRAGWAGEGSGAEAERLTNSPTMMGHSRRRDLGTAAYCPEQRKDRPPTRRTSGRSASSYARC
jgi:hypothetical protein